MKEKAGGADQRGKTAGVAHRQVRRDPAAERQAAEETGDLIPYSPPSRRNCAQRIAKECHAFGRGSMCSEHV